MRARRGAGALCSRSVVSGKQRAARGAWSRVACAGSRGLAQSIDTAQPTRGDQQCRPHHQPSTLRRTAPRAADTPHAQSSATATLRAQNPQRRPELASSRASSGVECRLTCRQRTIDRADREWTGGIVTGPSHDESTSRRQTRAALSLTHAPRVRCSPLIRNLILCFSLDCRLASLLRARPARSSASRL